jgi:hypothetical protein
VFPELPPSALGEVWPGLGRRVRRAPSQKQPRGPKKPKPKKASGSEKKPLSTAKLLKDQQPRK